MWISQLVLNFITWNPPILFGNPTTSLTLEFTLERPKALIQPFTYFYTSLCQAMIYCIESQTQIDNCNEVTTTMPTQGPPHGGPNMGLF